MTDRHTIPVTLWTPTRYGVLVAFVTANRAECKTAEERQYAAEVVKKLAPAYHAAKRDFEPLTKADFSAEDFPAKCDAFDATSPPPIAFSRSCWTWLAKILVAAPEPGFFATMRVRVDRSVADAKDEDAPLAS